MKRRDFITLLAGAAAWPLAARAQQGERMRRVGMLMNTQADDPLGQPRAATFQETLQELGWIEGKSVKVDYRWRDQPIDLSAAELIKLAPDVIVAAGSSNLAAAQHASRTLPIVFVLVTDPVGSGFVAGLARPGGNATGFITFEYSMSGKWLELLKHRRDASRRSSQPRHSIRHRAIQCHPIGGSIAFDRIEPN
jgi:putative tryptophan/tyrosine transport system substrate-binding protein